eukprot:scaffold22603_cov116-Cylindrotheca_fusiformis.AAC.5
MSVMGTTTEKLGNKTDKTKLSMLALERVLQVKCLVARPFKRKADTSLTCRARQNQLRMGWAYQII